MSEELCHRDLDVFFGQKCLKIKLPPTFSHKCTLNVISKRKIGKGVLAQKQSEGRFCMRQHNSFQVKNNRLVIRVNFKLNESPARTIQ